MTDNIITKDEAIDRKKAGLPCETLFESSDSWCETMWRDFDFDTAPVFRKPPKPRREARVFTNVGYLRAGTKNILYALDPPADLREILPGDVVLQRMTEREWINWLDKNAHNKLEALHALGLIGEGS